MTRKDDAIITQIPLGIEISSDTRRVGVSPTLPTLELPSQEPAGRAFPTELTHSPWEPPPGSYGLVVAWQSGTFWLRDLRALLATEEGDRARKTEHDTIAASTLYAIAAAVAPYADRGTGRSVTVAHATIAAQLGVCRRTIGRAWRVLERLGLAQTVLSGRYLTAAERSLIKSRHGRHQIRRASTRALTGIRRTVHLPPVETGTPQSPVSKMVKHQRASARNANATHPRGRGQSRVKANPGRRAYAPWPSDFFEFGAAFTRRFWWLGEHHPASVCAMLNRAGIDPARWTADALADAINAGMTARGITMNHKSRRSSIAYAAWLISTTINHDEPTPVELQRDRAAARERDRARLAAERAAEASRAQSIDHEEVAAIIARSNAETAERNRLRAQQERAARIERDRLAAAELLRRRGAATRSAVTE